MGLPKRIRILGLETPPSWRQNYAEELKKNRNRVTPIGYIMLTEDELVEIMEKAVRQHTRFIRELEKRKKKS